MKISLLLWRNKKSKKHPIKIAVHYKEDKNNYKRKVFDTGVHLEEEYWDKEKKTISQFHPNYYELMKKIEAKEVLIRKQLELNDNNINSLDYLKDYEKNKQLVTFLNKYIERIKLENRYGTARKYIALRNHLINYQKIRGKTLFFSDINIEFLEDFRNYFLENDHPYKNANGYKGNFEKLQVIFKEGIKRRYIKQDIVSPFKFIDFDTSPSTNEALSKRDFHRFFLEENKKIREKCHPLQYQNFIRAKNMFLIQFFAQGIRISDLLRLKWKNLQDENIIYKATKNGKNQTVYLFDEIVQLLRYFLPDPFKKLYSKMHDDSGFYDENTIQFLKECNETSVNTINEELKMYGLQNPLRKMATSIKGKRTKDFESVIHTLRLFITLINRTNRKEDHIFLNNYIDNRLRNLYDKEKIYAIYEYERAKYNRHLKVVSEKLQLNLNRLTSHVARHTYSYLFRENDGDIYSLKQSLQHSSVKVTEQYLTSINYQKNNKANEQLIEKMRKSKFDFFNED